MAEMATYNIPKTQTARLTAAAVARGARLIINATTDLASVAGDAVVGEFVALTDGAASGVIAVAPIASGGSIGVKNTTGAAVTIGATIYAAAGGEVTPTAGTVIIGKARTASAVQSATNPGLFVVQLENPL